MCEHKQISRKSESVFLCEKASKINGFRRFGGERKNRVAFILTIEGQYDYLEEHIAQKMAETAVRNNVVLKLNSPVDKITKHDGDWIITVGKETFETRYVINAAGGESDKVHDFALAHTFDILPNRGEYYLLDKSEGDRVERTIFQCPSSVGKGVLVSPTVHGNLIVGPNSEDIDCLDVSTTSNGLKTVKDSAKKSIPTIDFSSNIRNFAGIRAKSSRSDFIIQEHDHFIDVAGICSPGLSSAPAIAEYVTDILAKEGLNLIKKKEFIDSRKRIKVKELNNVCSTTA